VALPAHAFITLGQLVRRLPGRENRLLPRITFPSTAVEKPSQVMKLGYGKIEFGPFVRHFDTTFT
jgi:hypothetical protein